VRRWRSGDGDDHRAAPLNGADDSLVEDGDEPLVRLVRWRPAIAEDEDHAAYKHAVAGSSHADPERTLVALHRATGIPVGALARHVLAEWAATGASALLEAGPTAIQELVEAADAVDAAPQGLARDEAWAALRGRIHWLARGVEDPSGTYPDGGAGPVRRRRVGAYGLAVAPDRAVLLCRVADGFPGAGRWTLPGGGLEHGEHPHRGLVREFAEETGLPAQVGDFLLTDSHHIVRDDRDLHLLRLVWRVAVPLDREPVVEEDGGSTDEVAWIDEQRLQRLPLLSVATRALEAADLRAPRPDRSDGAV
jgi:ADP-ribose pyrophosphatase YjhB (NUDIX family)